MGKVHPLIIQQLKEDAASYEAQKETSETITQTAATSENEVAANSDGMGEQSAPQDPALKAMPEMSEAVTTLNVPDPNAVLPSQLDNLSSNDDGPITRLEFQALMARVVLVESWILRHGSKI